MVGHRRPRRVGYCHRTFVVGSDRHFRNPGALMSDYERPLAVAVEAAREAGAMLREEFHRPGGPRGSGGHADIDAQAEARIRGRLLRACPWGYLGEETG